VQASRLASLPPAYQSGPSGKAKCYHHSLTKNGNVRNLTNERTASSVGERERAKPAFFFFLRLRVDKSVRIHSKKLTSVHIHLTQMCANLLAELVGPRDLVCAGFTSRLTAPSPSVWSKQKSRVSFTYKKWKCQKLDKNNNVIFYIYFVHPRKLFQKYFLAYTLRGLARANACDMSSPAVKCLD
jgi:hypothetical protein